MIAYTTTPGINNASAQETRHASSWRKHGRIRQPAQLSEKERRGFGLQRVERSPSGMAAADGSKVTMDIIVEAARLEVKIFICVMCRRTLREKGRDPWALI